MGINREIRAFPDQLKFEPEIQNAERFAQKSRFVVCGMGGSNMGSSIIEAWRPEVSIFEHRDYGLPAISEALAKATLFIMSSYSGNTEETIDAYDTAMKKGYDLAVVAVGGKLLEKAKADGAAYIQLPDTNIQPRSALGFSVLAMMKLMGAEDWLNEMHDYAKDVDIAGLEAKGKELADALKNKVPVFYASQRFATVSRIAKIKMNETAKIPAFYNAMPEHNHNEINGFDVQDATKHLYDKFVFVQFHDSEDHPRVQKRMNVVTSLLEKRDLPVVNIQMEGKTVLQKIFNTLILVDWAAYFVGTAYGNETAEVPVVEEFKRLVK